MPISNDTITHIMRRDYREALRCLESLIMCTPTGPVRDLLTEANLRVMEAEQLSQEHLA